MLLHLSKHRVLQVSPSSSKLELPRQCRRHHEPCSQEHITPSSSTKISLNSPKAFCWQRFRRWAVYAKAAAVLEVEQSSVAWVGWICFYFWKAVQDKLWHSEYAIMQQTMNPVPWVKFESFMLSTFGTIAPLSEAYKVYEQCKQTSTVAEFVSRLRACAQRLKGTFLQQSEGSLTIKFFNGLKPSILKLVEDSAPVGWWTSIEQVFQKAINFELNQAACARQTTYSVCDTCWRYICIFRFAGEAQSRCKRARKED